MNSDIHLLSLLGEFRFWNFDFGLNINANVTSSQRMEVPASA